MTSYALCAIGSGALQVHVSDFYIKQKNTK